jgi:hypothetical protein
MPFAKGVPINRSKGRIAELFGGSKSYVAGEDELNFVAELERPTISVGTDHSGRASS